MDKKILIVDDDEDLCHGLEEILLDEGYLVDTAHTGEEGIALIKMGEYGVVLLDLKMPGMGGYRALEKIKEEFSKIKVIIITGAYNGTDHLSDSENFKEKNKNDLGEKVLRLADGILIKPFDIEKMLERVEQLVKGSGLN